MQRYQTKLLSADPFHLDPAVIDYAATLLRAGEVVVFPTETVYGLGADALHIEAVQRIFAAKGRPFNDPLIVHIADEAMLVALTTTLPAGTAQLIRAFWPGPLTLILPRSPLVPDIVTSGLPTVAIRMPRHPVALALIRTAGVPIAAPSANRFMHVSPTTAQHALADLAGRVPLILDSGPCEVGVESTVLDLTVPIPTILRPGGISLEALRIVLPQVHLPAQRNPVSNADEEAQHSPGQMLTHYAPLVPLLLYDGSVAAMQVALLAEVQKHVAHGERVGVLIADEDIPIFQASKAIVYSVGSAAAPQEVAAALFAGLRALEEMHVQVILSRSFAAEGLGLAIRDRLLKAAGGHIVHLTD